MYVMEHSVNPIAPIAPTRPLNRRSSARSPVYMRVEDKGRGDVLEATDIGLGGIQCTSKKHCWPGQFMELEFTLPELGEQIRVGAQVLNMEPADGGGSSLGLRFCRVPEATTLVLYQFLVMREALLR
ncbi:MAG: PilZ domain-containing protein [Deltaproteobacteria bacterium]|jgi:hypothetical protein|nr:PilZ domain-containing protein [Deltaproteobacteria bacterium]MBT6433603.1 PilZ domain-containing protein [Deltaproteobacteria bacterium]